MNDVKNVLEMIRDLEPILSELVLIAENGIENIQMSELIKLAQMIYDLAESRVHHVDHVVLEPVEAAVEQLEAVTTT